MGTTESVLQNIIWRLGRGHPPGQPIQRSADLVEDLEFDSYDRVEAMLMIEVHAWGVPVEIHDKEWAKVRTFGDLVNLIEEKLENGGLHAEKA
jgi:acyl carrier protein